MKSPTPRVMVWTVFLFTAAAPGLWAQTLNQQKQTPPVKMGTSGGSAADVNRSFCCGGTLGSLITRDNVLYVLSNNHILARSGGATVGEQDIQPGLIDSACSAAGDNIVGTFPGNFVPLGTANVDVGLSQANPGVVDTTGAILEVGVPCTATQQASIGLPVTKSGRTTGQTFGTVQAVNVNVTVQYQVGCNRGKKFTIAYTNQVSITGNGGSSFSAGGDSGSLIVSNNSSPNHPTALLYAGSSTTTIGNPIGDVVNALSAGGHTISFVGNSSCSAPLASSVLSPGSQILSGPSENDVEVARMIKERHEPDLFAHAEVIGVGVGADEKEPGKAVIVVYVVGNGGVRSHGLPSDLEGVPVHVIPTAPFVAF